MDARRQFYDAGVGFLPAVAEAMASLPADELAKLTVVLPGRRAGRDLFQAFLTQAQGKALPVPDVITPGDLQERLVTLATGAGGAISPRAARRAYLSAAGKITPAAQAALGFDPAGRLEDHVAQADVWIQLDTDLAQAGMSFAQVAEQCGDDVRWRALQELRGGYLQQLTAAGLTDGPTRLREAIAATDAICLGGPVWLCGVVDMPDALPALLGRLADEVTLHIPADETLDATFDALGRCDLHAWAAMELPSPAGRLHAVGDSRDQSREVLAILDEVSPFPADGVRVVELDEPSGELIRMAMGNAGLTTHRASGVSIRESQPFRLLQALRDAGQGRSWQLWATLLRGVEFRQHIARLSGITESDILELMDFASSEILPSRLEMVIPAGHPDADKLERAANVVAAMRETLRAFFEETAKPLAAWGTDVLELLSAIFGHLTLGQTAPANVMSVAACKVVLDTFQAERGIPEALGPGRSIDAMEAMNVLLVEIQSARLPEPQITPDSVEFIGWLDVALDVGPHVIVPQFVTRHVPESVPSHPYLPESLCRQLGLRDDRHRFARDMFIAWRLAAGRRTDWIIPTVDTEARPLLPSRLLFTRRPMDNAKRLIDFKTARDSRPIIHLANQAPPAARSGFVRASSDPAHQYSRETISVSAIDTYLKSPLLFYLKYVLNLRQADEGLSDMQPANFGTFVHNVLQDMADDPELKSTHDLAVLRDGLTDLAQQRVARSFTALPPAVELQVIQAQNRLAVYAQREIEHRLDGWQIVQSEKTLEVAMPGWPYRLRGKVDRVDRHPELGYAVWDYKTGTSPKVGKQGSILANGWGSLQLPLYRHLLSELYPDSVGRCSVGYIRLLADPGAIKFEPGQWDEECFELADDSAVGIVRAIAEGEFEELGDLPSYLSPTLQAICGVGGLEGGDDE